MYSELGTSLCSAPYSAKPEPENWPGCLGIFIADHQGDWWLLPPHQDIPWWQPSCCSPSCCRSSSHRWNHRGYPLQGQYCHHLHQGSHWCWSGWLQERGNRVATTIGGFISPALGTATMVLGDIASLISKLPNFSLSCSIDGLTGSFHSAGSSHLANHLIFHLLPQTTLTPEGSRGSLASASLPTFIIQRVFSLW